MSMSAIYGKVKSCNILQSDGKKNFVGSKYLLSPFKFFILKVKFNTFQKRCSNYSIMISNSKTVGTISVPFVLAVCIGTLHMVSGFSAISKSRHPIRIIGGTPAMHTEFPYQVSLSFFKQHRCGGAIIGSSYVLTAAHCVSNSNPSDLSIMVGTLSLSFPEVTVQIRKVSKTIIHSKYNSMGNDYDIALIRLKTPLDLNDAVSTVQLPNFGFEVASSRNATVTGWGVTDQGFGSDFLRMVEIPVVPHRICEDAYIVSVDESIIKDTMICAGEAGKDSCQGDSGGPLTINYGFMDNGKPVRLLVGVTAFGMGCGEAGYPGVYTKVAAFREWIAQYSGI